MADGELALAVFENEGGQIGESVRMNAKVNETSLPLSPGYTSQPVWGFRDPTGRIFYSFFCVYEYQRGARAQLDEELSFWAATWLSSNVSGVEVTQVRSMTYREARQSLGSRLGFGDFSSQAHMRERLPELLKVD